MATTLATSRGEKCGQGCRSKVIWIKPAVIQILGT